MKRILLTLVASAMCVVAFAQNPLVGTWVFFEKDSESGNTDGVDTDLDMTVTDNLTINADNTYTEVLQMDVAMSGAKEGKTVTLSLTVVGSMNGAWTYEGNILTLTPDKKSKPKVTVKNDNFPALFRMMLVKPLTKEVQNGLKEVNTSQVLSVTANELTLKEYVDPSSKKKGKEEDPEIIVFKRK